MTRPAMDNTSVAFAVMLDNMSIEADTDGVLHMTCSLCSESICDVEDGDTMRVLLNTAFAHDCPPPKRKR